MKAFISNRRELSSWLLTRLAAAVAGGSSVCGFYLPGTRTAALCLASYRESV